jgi:hypothetical protein
MAATIIQFENRSRENFLKIPYVIVNGTNLVFYSGVIKIYPKRK